MANRLSRINSSKQAAFYFVLSVAILVVFVIADWARWGEELFSGGRATRGLVTVVGMCLTLIVWTAYEWRFWRKKEAAEAEEGAESSEEGGKVGEGGKARPAVRRTAEEERAMIAETEALKARNSLRVALPMLVVFAAVAVLCLCHPASSGFEKFLSCLLTVQSGGHVVYLMLKRRRFSRQVEEAQGKGCLPSENGRRGDDSGDERTET